MGIVVRANYLNGEMQRAEQRGDTATATRLRKELDEMAARRLARRET
jgi:hypothetical protein